MPLPEPRMSNKSSEPQRIVSLDQFRGYTVLGMFLVNFIGSFAVIGVLLPVLQHHHTYCSYADTIMPQFLFAVGFAYRLTLLRRLEAGETWSTYARVVQRNLGLILLAFVIYPLGGGLKTWSELSTSRFADVLVGEFKRNLFQTLTHIGVTSLWVLPVMASRPAIRVAYAACSGVLHLGLSYWFNYTWVNSEPRGIDGGPLGFLTWSIPLLAGSLAYDAWMAGGPSAAIRKCLLWGLALMVIGHQLSCLNLAPSEALGAQSVGLTFRSAPLPFVYVDQKPPDNNLFTMSQRSGSISYLVFGAGLSLAVYALFVALCDVRGWQLGIFRTLGVNALAGYILHSMVADAVKPFVPKDAPLWYVSAAFGVYLAICYVLLRYMEKHRLFLRL
jgi:predicted acyltransferase